MRLNEILARLHGIAHQRIEKLVSLLGVVHHHLLHQATLRVHRGIPKLLGIHFAVHCGDNGELVGTAVPAENFVLNAFERAQRQHLVPNFLEPEEHERGLSRMTEVAAQHRSGADEAASTTAPFLNDISCARL